jgi:hypothetical protein
MVGKEMYMELLMEMQLGDDHMEDIEGDRWIVWKCVACSVSLCHLSCLDSSIKMCLTEIDCDGVNWIEVGQVTD